ncbi:MAG TPA: hypothetical protein VMG31_15140 [Verrucomicrobiae bacterium]|nr:hypothetical protein [Verrucomicrobiae bacterium]
MQPAREIDSTSRFWQDGRAPPLIVRGNGDTGADPDWLVVVFDKIANTDPAVAARESFFTLRQAGFGEVPRGVSFTPGTPDRR